LVIKKSVVIKKSARASSEPDSARAPRGADLGEPTVLLLVRHGRTPLTEQRRMSGTGGADPGLSDAGRTDAAGAAALLAALGGPVSVVPDVATVDAIACSPLRRTRETAGVIAGRLGLPVTPIDGWAEIAFGAWDGLTYGEIAARWPDELAAWQGSVTVAPPGGESLADHAARIRAARVELVAAHPGRTVVVVAHVTPIRCVVAEALDAGPAALWRTRISPASVTAVRYWADGGVEVLAVNRVP
jgi:probable phosphoglycerate mutase